MMSLDAALAQSGRRVAVWDSGYGGDVLSIVAVERHDASVIVRAEIARAERSVIERQLAQAGIPIGATHSGCGFVWVCTDEQLAVVQLDAGITLEALGADLLIAGRCVKMRDVDAVQWYEEINEDVVHGGVRLWLANGEVLTIAEELDPIDPMTNLDFFGVGGGWMGRLGRDLAARLGVPLRDATKERS